MTKTLLVAKVLLVNQDGNILTLRRSETAPRRPLEDDIPGGWVDEGEDFTTAAVRETEEEAGIKLDRSEVGLIYAHSEMRPEGNVCWLFYVGHTQNTAVKLSSEHDRFEWKSLDAAIESINYKLHQDFLIYVRDNNLI